MKITRDWQLLLLFVFISILFRLVSFFPSVLDHDETTYMIMGSELLHGKSLYVDVTDTKPVGIFIIYAFLQSIFGYSIFLKRLFVSVLIGLTSYLLSRVSLKLFDSKRVAVASGLIYIFYTSIWTRVGVSPNTELFFNFFTISALLLFFKKSTIRYSIAGLLLGIGFIIKYLVLLDFLAFASFFLFVELQENKWRISLKQFLPYFYSGVGFALPFILVNVYFYFGDHFEAFRFVTYELPGRYREGTSITKYILMLLDYTGRFLPVSFLLFYVLIKKNSLFIGWKKQFLIYWMIAILIAIYLPGKSFTHYAIQLMLPSSLIASLAFHPDFVFDKFTAKLYKGRRAVVLLVVLIVSLQASSVVSKVTTHDKPDEIAEYLHENLDEDEFVYVANYWNVIYYLLKQEVPTPYVHSTILSNPKLASAFNVEQAAEIKRILDQKPRYIVIYKSFDLVENAISNEYKLEKTFRDGKILVYELASLN